MALSIPAHAEIKSLEIIAPANPGGGWDQTARAVQTALQEDKLAAGIQVQNIAGAGGTIGLAQFVTSKKKKGDAILVGGLVMVGAILTNKAPVTLDDVTPLARLTGEYELIVVPADSPLKTMGDLVAKLKADPGSVSWGGGSTGGTDHILAALIAKAAGVDPTKVNYIAHSGGGEALSSILGGHVTAGISGYEEFAPQIAAGKLRGLAISSDERLRRRRRADPQGAGPRRVDRQLARRVRAAPDPRQGQEGPGRRDRQDGRRARSGRTRSPSAAGSTSTSRPTSSPPSSPRTAPRSRRRSRTSASSSSAPSRSAAPCREQPERAEPASPSA